MFGLRGAFKNWFWDSSTWSISINGSSLCGSSLQWHFQLVEDHHPPCTDIAQSSQSPLIFARALHQEIQTSAQAVPLPLLFPCKGHETVVRRFSVEQESFLFPKERYKQSLYRPWLYRCSGSAANFAEDLVEMNPSSAPRVSCSPAPPSATGKSAPFPCERSQA